MFIHMLRLDFTCCERVLWAHVSTWCHVRARMIQLIYFILKDSFHNVLVFCQYIRFCQNKLLIIVIWCVNPLLECELGRAPLKQGVYQSCLPHRIESSCCGRWRKVGKKGTEWKEKGKEIKLVVATLYTPGWNAGCLWTGCSTIHRLIVSNIEKYLMSIEMRDAGSTSNDC